MATRAPACPAGRTSSCISRSAQIPGRPAPKLLSKAMIESMRPGSIIVDLAAERGGNAELAKANEIVSHNGVRIFGKLNLAGSVAVNASSLYARNLQAFVEPMIDKEKKILAINFADELVKGTLIAKDGAIVNAMIAERLGGKPVGAPAAAPAKPANGNGKANGNGNGKKPAPKRQPKGSKA